jgi:hypothetical protein
MTTVNENKSNTYSYDKETYDFLSKSLLNKHQNVSVFEHNKKNIYCLFEHNVPKEFIESVELLIKSQCNCRTCIRNMRILSKYSTLDGSLFLTSDMISHIEKDTEYYYALVTLMNKIVDYPIVNMKVIDKTLFGPFEVGGFMHWKPTINQVDPVSDFDFYQQVIDKYIRDGLIEKLIKDMISNEGGFDSAITSLKLMDECCKKATYGDTFLGTVTWLKKFAIEFTERYNGLSIDQIKPKDKYVLLTQLLFNGKVTKDFNGGVCTNYHQANNNVLDLMKEAKSENAMVKMLTERLNPLNYLRRDETKVLSDKVVDQAIKILGDFKNTIMTHEQVSALKDCITLNNEVDVSSSLSGFEKMKLEAKSNTNKGFASRCGKDEEFLEIKKITKIIELIEYIKLYPKTNLELSMTNMNPLKLVDSTLLTRVDEDGDKLVKVPFFWAFSIGHISEVGFKKVSHIVPMWGFCKYNNVYFGVDVNKGDTRNCCFPDFLSDKYLRVLGPAFEKLNTTTQVNIPTDAKLAYGVGTSSSDRDHKIKPLTFRINGTEIKITHIK